MEPTVEKIREEIRLLSPAERLSLWQEMQDEFDPSVEEESHDPEIEAAWDREIDARVSEVEGGKVETISAESFAEDVEALFAELGIVPRIRPA